jgi:hypothetical protein
VDIFHRLNQGPAFPQLSTEKSRALADTYRADVEALERVLERDLSHWLAIDGDARTRRMR